MLTKLFVNPPGQKGEKITEAYGRQAGYLKAVWNEESFGLVRLVRLALCLAQFFFPILLIRDVMGRWGGTARKLAVEAYTVFKFIFPLAVLKAGWYHYPVVIFLIIYFLSETLVHILHLIFLSDIHAVSVSYRRSLVLIFLHYAEVAFDFAVFYTAFGLLTGPVDPVRSLYFSLVATTTVGFGDIVAQGRAGQLTVMAQVSVCVVFIIVFINYFTQKINEE